MARGKKPIRKKIKRGNGKGSIKKLSGNRVKPYAVIVTTGREWDDVNLRFKPIRKYIGYYKTETEAMAELDKYNLNPWDVEAKKFTFEDVYEMWSKRYYYNLKNPSSERSYTAAYKHCGYIYKKNFASITVTDLKDTIQAANVSVNLQSRMKSLFNLMYDFAIESQICNINMARNFNLKGLGKKIAKSIKVKELITNAHEDLLWDNLEYGYTRMVLIGIYTGFRPHELCILEKDNVNLHENYIIGGEKTEAGEDRYVPIHPKILDLVTYYYNRTKTKFLFSAADGINDSTMTYDKYRGRFKKAFTAIGVPSDMYSPHCTRHAFITKAKLAGMNEFALKLIVGHEINDVTERVYTHRDNESFLQSEILKIK